MEKKKNIIFIFSDQQRHDTLGCYGQKLDVTPNIDFLASQGVRFENAFTPQPVCGPARACIQTGMYGTQHGCFKNDIALPITDNTLAHQMTKAGYYTGYIGKWHLASTGLKQNYKKKAVPKELRGGWNDYWLASDVLEFTSTGYEGHLFDKDNKQINFNKYRVDALTDYAIDFLEESQSKDKPFFLFLSFLEPHHQNTTHRFEGPSYSKERFSDFETPKDLEGTKGDWRKSYPDYLGCCHSIDDNVGRILSYLKDKNIFDETIIIYTSDHGSHFKTRNMEYKRSCHESSIRIPLIIKGEGFNNPSIESSLVSLIDLTPTILKIAGLKVPSNMAGDPLQEINNKDEEWKKDIFIQISESQVGRAIRTKRWKYSMKGYGRFGYLHSSSDKYIEDCLYDLENDPYEKNNLILSKEYIKEREFLSKQLVKRMVDAGESKPIILPKRFIYKVLGYFVFILELIKYPLKGRKKYAK